MLRKLSKGIVLSFMILLALFLCFRSDHRVPLFSEILSMSAELPNLPEKIIKDMEDIRKALIDIPYSFNFVAWGFPSFDSSNPEAFFRSIGIYLSSFGANLYNTFNSMFKGFNSISNALGKVFKCFGTTVINIITYILGLIHILFG